MIFYEVCNILVNRYKFVVYIYYIVVYTTYWRTGYYILYIFVLIYFSWALPFRARIHSFERLIYFESSRATADSLYQPSTVARPHIIHRQHAQRWENQFSTLPAYTMWRCTLTVTLFYFIQYTYHISLYNIILLCTYQPV